MVDLSKFKIVIVIFAQPGCGACEDYLPRFKALAAPYESCLPVVVLDVNDQKFAWLADRHKVEYTPTTLVLRKPRGAIKIDGSVDDGKIQEILHTAVKGLSCDI